MPIQIFWISKHNRKNIIAIFLNLLDTVNYFVVETSHRIGIISGKPHTIPSKTLYELQIF